MSFCHVPRHITHLPVSYYASNSFMGRNRVFLLYQIFWRKKDTKITTKYYSHSALHTALRRPTAQAPCRVDVTSLVTWSQGQKTVPSPVLFCGIDRAYMAYTQGWWGGIRPTFTPCAFKWGRVSRNPDMADEMTGEKQLIQVHAGCHNPKMNKQFLQWGLAPT